MEIWIMRHGETDYNKSHLMQGQIDIPLNEKGRNQAEEKRKEYADISFDAIYTSPLERAVETAKIFTGTDRIQKDKRIIEAGFGVHEGVPYHEVGLHMLCYWTMPWLFTAPLTAETISSMKERVGNFFDELKEKPYERVLIVCHGGIMRVICGYLEKRKSGLKWYPKPKNCEVRIYHI